ncbi:MAG: NfeD family protein, partial [Lachnospiraceae bacterium]|nr:NfeD family protein [Lachnospiraceae bacterium]
AVVTATIHNLQESGQVIVDGKEWTARSNDAEKVFEKGEIVRIVSISGVKLMVEAL